MIAVGVALVAALGGLWYQTSQFNSVRSELATNQQKIEQMRGQMDTSVSVAKAEANESIAKMNEQMSAKVAAAQKEARSHIYQTQALAKKQNSQMVEDMTAKNAELVAQLDKMKADGAETSTKVDETLTGIKTDVGTVKTDVASTKTELDKTIADLHRVNGDMGVMSGLIATNSSELDALRKLGERDYFEFTLAKNESSQNLGGVQLALKKADAKRNRFTMDVVADDKRVEKRDKGVNEPVQFYTSQARIPFEIVVNQVTKDKVKGYLSAPKVKVARTSTSGF
jgi:hypothetical protein